MALFRRKSDDDERDPEAVARWDALQSMLDAQSEDAPSEDAQSEPDEAAAPPPPGPPIEAPPWQQQESWRHHENAPGPGSWPGAVNGHSAPDVQPEAAARPPFRPEPPAPPARPEPEPAPSWDSWDAVISSTSYEDGRPADTQNDDSPAPRTDAVPSTESPAVEPPRLEQPDPEPAEEPEPDAGSSNESTVDSAGRSDAGGSLISGGAPWDSARIVLPARPRKPEPPADSAGPADSEPQQPTSPEPARSEPARSEPARSEPAPPIRTWSAAPIADPGSLSWVEPDATLESARPVRPDPRITAQSQLPQSFDLPAHVRQNEAQQAAKTDREEAETREDAGHKDEPQDPPPAPPMQPAPPQQFGPPQQYGRPPQYGPPAQFGPPPQYGLPAQFGPPPQYGPPPGPPAPQQGPPNPPVQSQPAQNQPAQNQPAQNQPAQNPPPPGPPQQWQTQPPPPPQWQPGPPPPPRPDPSGQQQPPQWQPQPQPPQPQWQQQPPAVQAPPPEQPPAPEPQPSPANRPTEPVQPPETPPFVWTDDFESGRPSGAGQPNPAQPTNQPMNQPMNAPGQFAPPVAPPQTGQQPGQPQPQPQPQQGPPGPPIGPGGMYVRRPGAPSVDDLTASALVERRSAPQVGWRKAVYRISAHAVNPGISRGEQHRRELISQATVPVHGCYRIAVISLKGGVGKTTSTVCLGATLASLRGDRVIAVDANPDRGTLSGKIPLQTTATVRNLLNDVDRIERYSDVRRYTSQSPDRLEVLASESDPSVSLAFSEADYRKVAGVLERFYNVVLTDCGTGLLHSAMAGVLAMANQLVVVSSGSVDGARSASATIDWLEAHGYSRLVAGSVAVINSVRPKSGGVNLDALEEHFASRCRAVTRIPYDTHLELGAEVDLAELAPPTRDSLLELAADVAAGFPQPDGPPAPPMQPYEGQH